MRSKKRLLKLRVYLVIDGLTHKVLKAYTNEDAAKTKVKRLAKNCLVCHDYYVFEIKVQATKCISKVLGLYECL